MKEPVASFNFNRNVHTQKNNTMHFQKSGQTEDSASPQRNTESQVLYKNQATEILQISQQ